MLSDLQIRRLQRTPREAWHSDGNSLNLRQRITGGLTWVRRRKKQHGGNITIGPYPAIGVAEARRKNLAMSGAVVTNFTLGELLQAWYDEVVQVTYRRPHHADGYISRLDPVLKGRKLRDLTRLEIRKCVKAYAVNNGPVAARRLLSILKTALRFSVDAGYADGSPIEGMSPDLIAAAEESRDRVLTDEEIKGLRHAKSQHTPLLRFLLLTGQRIGETQLARWTEHRGCALEDPRSPREECPRALGSAVHLLA